VLDSSQTEKTKMDFFTMERKNLQTLSKKHGIPANLKNIEMAQKLSLIYKVLFLKSLFLKFQFLGFFSYWFGLMVHKEK
jgi:hypothetical protein